jgi:Zn-dependent protease
MSDQWLPPTPPSAPGYDPPKAEGSTESWFKRKLGPIALALFAVFKFGKIAILFVTKAKFFVTGFSMVISIGAYTLFWGLPFALGIVALLLVHESGHAIQMKREGMDVGGMAFVPFLGAVVWAKELEDDALAEARVGLAGPLLGSLAAAAALIPYAIDGNEFWLALAYFGFFINLFNLIPVTPFDGGRAMAAISPWMWFAGLGLLAAYLVWRPNPFVILFLALGAFDVYRRWKQRKEGGLEARAYYEVSKRNRALVGIVYVGLVLALVAGMNATHLDPDSLG